MRVARMHQTVVGYLKKNRELRDVLGMTGTKFGCGMALCGACTVHVNGEPTRSCITSIDSIGTSAVTTIEAIGMTTAGAKIQKAWLDRDGLRIGRPLPSRGRRPVYGRPVDLCRRVQALGTRANEWCKRVNQLCGPSVLPWCSPLSSSPMMTGVNVRDSA